MQAIIFLDRTGEELTPLHEHLCPALLPVAGRSLAEHCLEELSSLGVTEAFVVIGPQHEAIQSRLEEGQRWSIALRYVLASAGESPDAVRARLGRTLQAPYLALRGDVLRTTGTLGRVVRDNVTPTQASSLLWLTQAGVSLGIQRILHEPCTLSPLSWPLALTTGIDMQADIQFRVLDSANIAPLMSLKNYHQEALAALAEALGYDNAEPDTALPSGLPRGVGLRAGHCSDIHHRSLEDGIAWVGHFSRVHEEARLQGNVAIGDHCLIDRGAHISDSLVLDNSYVGAGVHLHNAIVYENQVIHLDSGAVLAIRDRFLFSRNGLELNTSQIAQRLLGLTLLTVSLPLWPLTGLLALAYAQRRPIERVMITDQLPAEAESLTDSPTVTAWRWNLPRKASLAWLANLPLLWLVARGRLRLLGRSPVSMATSPDIDAPWKKAHLALPIGLLSPADLIVAARQDTELRELIELEWLSHGLPRRLLHALRLRVFTSKKSVAASKEAPAPHNRTKASKRYSS